MTKPQDRHSLEQETSLGQLSQAIEAISNGKYSWACLLILEAAGYNPGLYMPYRTYRRLMQEYRT
ncbi:MAG: HetP family heterocyst commitment protein [Cyanobacteria bacterium P01_D01_bin.44]